MERLNKVLAQSNVASRRKADELISSGRIKVNDKVITELGFRVSDTDVIMVDNKLIKREKKVYILMNKPSGYISLNEDDKERNVITDLLEEDLIDTRLYPIGRLDFDTRGLILLTNDGDLTKRLTNPNKEIINEFIVRLEGVMVRKKIIELRKGLKVGKSIIKPIRVDLIEIDKQNQSTLLNIVLTESRNSVIKNMFETFKFPVKNLTRTKFAFLNIEGVKRGSYRELTLHEVRKLYSL